MANNPIPVPVRTRENGVQIVGNFPRKLPNLFSQFSGFRTEKTAKLKTWFKFPPLVQAPGTRFYNGMRRVLWAKNGEGSAQ